MQTLLPILILSLCSISMGAQDLTQGLIGYYSFCGCSANDQSGNENHGTLVGSPECIDGIKGEGFYFNRGGDTTGCGTTNPQYIQLPALGAIWEEGISICAWVKFENIANFERIVDLGNGEGDSGGLNLWFGREGNSNNLTLESWISADPDQNRSTGRLVAVDAITNGDIEFYCATITANTMSIYVNGQLVAQKQGNPIANIERTQNFIGRSNWCNSDPDFQGFMDEVRIYNRTLSAAEVFQLFDSPFISSNKDSLSICVKDSIQLNAQGGIAYQWSPGITLSAIDIPNPIATPPAPATYTVKITLPDGCFVTDTIRIHVNELEEIEINKTICEGSSYEGYFLSGTYVDQFTAQTGCDSFRTLNLTVMPGLMVSESKTICSGENYQGYSTTGVYEDRLNSSTGCDTFLTLNLTVIPSPTIHNIQLTPSSCGLDDGALSFDLADGTSLTTIQLNGNPVIGDLSFSQLTPGNYDLNVLDEQGCELDTLLIIQQEDCALFIPNVFSPNGDGINDEFKVFSGAAFQATVKSYRIFNRWGALVYEASNFSVESSGLWWTGRSNQEMAPEGTYVYFIEVEVEGGPVESFNGEVALIN